MAPPITNVLIIGNHLLSATIIHALADSPHHDYTLTILTCPHQTPLLSSSHPILHHHHPPTSASTSSPTIHRTTDFSLPSLTTAFHSQDLIISTISGSPALQTLIIDAALAAGVPRFVPAEFRPDSLDAGIQAALPPARGRAGVIAYLRGPEWPRLGLDGAEVAVGGNGYCGVEMEVDGQKKKEEEKREGRRHFEWVAIATGAPLDAKLLDGSLGFDLAWRSASVPGPGTQQFACSGIAHVGRVVAEVLGWWDEEGVKNNYLYAAEFVTSAKEVVGKLERAMGREWSVGVVEGGESRREAEERLRRGWMEKGGVDGEGVGLVGAVGGV